MALEMVKVKITIKTYWREFGMPKIKDQPNAATMEITCAVYVVVFTNLFSIPVRIVREHSEVVN